MQLGSVGLFWDSCGPNADWLRSRHASRATNTRVGELIQNYLRRSDLTTKTGDSRENVRESRAGFVGQGLLFAAVLTNG